MRQEEQMVEQQLLDGSVNAVNVLYHERYYHNPLDYQSSHYQQQKISIHPNCSYSMSLVEV
jgi:hypothetical protein